MNEPGSVHDARGLLGLWESASLQPPHRRGAALLYAAGIKSPRTLGQGNAQLLALHERLFGPGVELISQCPACGHTAQFDVDVHDLACQITPPETSEGQALELQVHGHTIRFRLPAPDDLAALAAATNTADDDEAFARNLIARCITDCHNAQGPMDAGELPAPALDALSQRIEALDPGAALSFALECPRCATPWSATLDAAELLWRQLQAAAERLLLEVDALARAYGWSEPEVLALSPLRRAAYLQMANA